MSYSEEEFVYDDDEFVAEFAARERVGSSKPTFIDVQIGIQKGKKGRLSLKSNLTSDQLFLFDLQNNYYRYQDDIPIGSDDIENIKSLVIKIPHINYKNPLAFLFAYYTLNINKKDINTDRLKRIKTIIKDIEGIELEDIIRYSRLINNFL
jgi:hypothetical protein